MHVEWFIRTLKIKVINNILDSSISNNDIKLWCKPKQWIGYLISWHIRIRVEFDAKLLHNCGQEEEK